MTRILFYLPLLLSDWAKLLLPRQLFIRIYTPSRSTQRDLEQKLQNMKRVAAYTMKKELFSA